ncbi:MAG: leucine-rich repeat domain-containing protein [Silvibacterium sp.]|nr:leucine-rich repeat domain-containing protein [Silvibacterium sp.]
MSVEVNLWNQALRRVPQWVWKQTELRTLILAGNRLTDLSEQIGGLQKLRTLDLGHNQLAVLPDSLGDLTGLRDFLYLHHNRLTAIPHSMERLKDLR